VVLSGDCCPYGKISNTWAKNLVENRYFMGTSEGFRIAPKPRLPLSKAGKVLIVSLGY